MQEPRCKICGVNDFVNGGGCHLQFKVIDPKEIAYNTSLEEFRFPGDCPAGEWYFCGKHIDIVAKYTHLPFQEASHLIRSEISEIKRLEIEKENKQFSNSFLVELGSKIREFFKRFAR